MNNFITTVYTVGIMLIYSLPGYALVKAKKINPQAIPAFATVLMYVCSSCLVVSSFQKVKYTPQMFRDLIVFFALSVVIQCVLLIVYYFIFRKKYDDVKYRVATVASCFGNCAFLGVPILESLLPNYPQAAAMSAVYSIAMNLIGWTAASAIIANDKKYIKLKSFVLNPAVIALMVALPLFFTNTYIGDTLFGDAVFLLGKMTTPMCMLIMGMRLASVSLKPVIARKMNYLVVVLKQFVMPVIGMLLVTMLPIDSNMKMSFYIICACPVASVVLNFSEMLGQGQEMSANLVLLGTFSSIITIPVMMLLMELPVF